MGAALLLTLVCHTSQDFMLLANNSFSQRTKFCVHKVNILNVTYVTTNSLKIQF